MIEELLSNSVAAQLLSELMPDKTPEQWALWLQNNRNNARRVAYRIPVEKLGGGVFYNREQITKFAEFEKSRQLGTVKLSPRVAAVLKAFGVGEVGGGRTGRKFDLTALTPQVDEATGKTFAQMIINNPSMVFRLELEDAEALANELGEVITFLKGINQEQPQQPDLSEYETVTDNKDVLVMRRATK